LGKVVAAAVARAKLARSVERKWISHEGVAGKGDTGQVAGVFGQLGVRQRFGWHNHVSAGQRLRGELDHTLMVEYDERSG
jgi:hypothetical protein